jgi:hypothetical protein
MDDFETPFAVKCEILSELWMDYRDDENFDDLFNYGDLAFPLAYAVTNNIIESNESVEKFIVEVFDLLVSSMGLEDTGFEDLDDIFLAGDMDGFEDENE